MNQLAIVPSEPEALPEVPAPIPAAPEKLTPLDSFDRMVRAELARATAGLSPWALAEAYFDWAVHLAHSPGRRLQLAGEAGRCLRAAALERFDLVVRGARLFDGRTLTADRHHGLERRRHAHALSHAFAIPALAVPR